MKVSLYTYPQDNDLSGGDSANQHLNHRGSEVLKQ